MNYVSSILTTIIYQFSSKLFVLRMNEFNRSETILASNARLFYKSTTYLISDPERILLGFWSLATIIIGGFGNILVLVSICIGQFQIDFTSKWFISNMSISDFLYILVIVVPTAVTNFSNRWIFGRFLCGLTASLSSMFCIIHLLSLTLLSANKLFRCLFPLRSIYTTLSAWSGTLITFLLWTVSLLPIVMNYVLDRPFTFDRNINRLGIILLHFKSCFLFCRT